ncbi:Diguanylate cyclase with PAS/PAC sensor and hemerythrin-like metal-binding domain [Burkholderiales bacterium]|nr:Diguanylate cyclase with PAS/PAC sensor and hemerythrin-like metal-binding domain [Burkholderiales bacterium]
MTPMHNGSAEPSPPAHQPAGIGDAIESFEIFPWASDFETGIAVVDEQHRTLVRLLNSLARSMAVPSDELSMEEVLRELSEYAVYHFDTEEGLMRDFFAGDTLESTHQQAHRQFVRAISRLKEQQSKRPLNKAIEEIVAFLSRWLVFHILDVDKRMATVVLALQAGKSLEEAKAQADRGTPVAGRVLIDAVLAMYEKLSSRTFQLMKEIVERKNAEIQLRRAATAFECALEAIFATDAQRLIVDGNASFCEFAGRARTELIGQKLEAVLPMPGQENTWERIWQSVTRQGLWRGEISVRAGSGEPNEGWMTLSAVRDDAGRATHYVGVLSNITQLIHRQHKLERLAFHDALTGLPNRLFLLERIRQAISQARRNGDLLAVCYLDIDGFKQINDDLGHAAGDQLLQEVAMRCQSIVRGNDTVARLGGDEFVILLGDLKQPQDCSHLLDRLIAAVRQPAALPAGEIAITVSIGVTLFPTDNAEPAALLQHADLAMYRAKRGGKSQYRYY